MYLNQQTSNTFLRFGLLTCILLSLSQTTLAQSQPSAKMASADQLFQAKKWSEAAQAYEDVVTNEPNNGRAWFQLGMARFSLKQFEPAIQALEKNISLTNNAVAMYNVACAHARLKQHDKALEWLGKALNGRLPPSVNPAEDEDFSSLRDDARFKELLTSMDKKRRPCMYSLEARQFDFWLGEWDVFNPQGQQVGTSVIQQIAHGCGILENWSGGGKSLNFYDPNDGKWYQYWIGGNGSPLRYSGNFKDGAMRYQTETTRQDGTKIFQRLTFFNVEGYVRQLAEQSDDGVTWQVSYDFKYVKKK